VFSCISAATTCGTSSEIDEAGSSCNDTGQDLIIVSAKTADGRPWTIRSDSFVGSADRRLHEELLALAKV
jgi:hypothetical protein